MTDETLKHLAEMIPQPGEQAAFVGQNGSGKTTLMVRLLGAYYQRRQIEVMDGKRDKIWQGRKAAFARKFIQVPRYGWPKYPLVVYRPSGEEGHDRGTLDDWCEWIYERGNTVACIDEVTLITPTPLAYGPGFLDLYTRSRARGVTLFSGTQRPVQVPRMMFSEAKHVFVFYLSDKRDREIVAGFTNPGVLMEIPDRYGFFYYNQANRDLRYFPG